MTSSPSGIDTSASRLIFLAMLGVMAGGFVAFRMLSKPVGPPPPEVAKDALLTAGPRDLPGAVRGLPRQ